uniref:Uncharacterized protein n=1 Tax=Klebsiella pneumoniae TaxID=573 RepID=A0A482M2T1_KLEPN|nr:Hypothetical protein [Klebsiella pneumoniae]
MRPGESGAGCGLPSGARRPKAGGVSGRCPRKRGETGTGSMRSTAERPRRGNALCGIRI